MKMILCRHAETDFNKEKRLQGWMETSINEKGQKQAQLLSLALKDEEFDYVFSSPQKRCMQTAREIMKFHKNEIIFQDELREINIGKYAGMDKQEIEQKFPGDWKKRVEDKYGFVHEGGESYAQVDEKRVKPLLAAFREKYSSRKILVITHQGTARLIIGNMLGLGPLEKMDLDCPNDCIYYIEYLPHKTTVKYSLVQSGKSTEGYLTKHREIV